MKKRKKSIITKNDYSRGNKRVNLTLDIEDVEKLVAIANLWGGVPHTTVAHTLLVQEIRERYEKRVKGKNELPGQTHLFKKEKK